ncbi:MAG: CCA tRNA nucleotidyltransferase [Elusimicrobia bacterium]|nr:CCA tRNA nucleotidyltransferase [Elusimicrobiota bacterium]
MLIPKNFLKILLALSRKKKEPLFLVGGALREAFLKIETDQSEPRDFDLILARGAAAVSQEFARKTKGRHIALDDQRRIYRVVTGEDSKRFHFDFGNFQAGTLAEDLQTRDLTINALAIDLKKAAAGSKSGQVIDPTGGLRDLKKKILRVAQEKNLADDPLRMLRIFRFAAQLDFKIEPATAGFIKKHARKIKKTAPERIRLELMKTMESPRAAKILKKMDEVGLLTQIFPVLERSRNLAPQYYRQGGVLGHALGAVDCYEESVKTMKRKWPSVAGQVQEYLDCPMAGGFTRRAVIKLGVLLHDVAKPHTARVIKGRLRFFGHDYKGAQLFEEIGRRLRFANEEIRLIAKIIRSHLRPGNLSEQPVVTDRAVWRFFRDLGEDGVGTLLNALADHQSYLAPKKRWDLKEPAVKIIKNLLEKYYLARSRVVPPKIITGHDVMKITGLPPSKEVGKILDRVESLQGEGKIKNRREAMELLKSFKK